jgi:hypothetical protein
MLGRAEKTSGFLPFPNIIPLYGGNVNFKKIAFPKIVLYNIFISKIKRG